MHLKKRKPKPKGSDRSDSREGATVFARLPIHLLPALDRLANDHEITRSRFIAIIIQTYLSVVEDEEARETQNVQRIERETHEVTR